MPKCSKCWEYVYQGENPNILLNPSTMEAHKCDPGNLRVPAGKWKGRTYREMAASWDRQRRITKQQLDEIRKNSTP